MLQIRDYAKALRWHAAVAWCVVTIQVVGLVCTLSNMVENVLRKFWRVQRYPSLEGKYAVVTGANRGLGRAITRLLVENGVHTVMLCRRQSAAEQAVQAMFRNEPEKQSLCTIVEVDLQSFQSVRKAADQVILTCMRHNTRLDFIVGNAGIMAPASFLTGADGYELQLEVNALSHALLMHLLLKAGVVHDSPASRLLSVSSFAHHGFTYLNDDDVLTTDPSMYHPKLAYSKSKWLQILLMRSLSRQIARTYHLTAAAVAVNPGVVDTMMARNYCKGEFPGWIRWLSDPVLDVLFVPTLRRAHVAAALILDVLVADAASVNGAYLSMGPLGHLTRRSYSQYTNTTWSDVIQLIDQH